MSNSPASLRATARQLAPCSPRPQGKPSFLFLRPPKGACGTLGKRPLPRPPASQAGIPHAIRKSTAHGRWPGFNAREVVQAEPGPRTQPFACVPHADGFVGLLDVPGFGVSAPAPRSCELSPGHSLEPSAPSAVVSREPFWTVRSSKHRQGRQSLRTSAPRSTPRDHRVRAPYRYGTGAMIFIIGRQSRTKSEH
jgi:hypothetical protein